jgi:WD40 repeat protein
MCCRSLLRQLFTAAQVEQIILLHCCLQVMKLDGHRDFSFAVEWHPGGQLLATGNQDSTTRVWDIRQPSSPLAVLGGSMGAIRALRFSPDGACLAAAEPADFVHVYDVASGFSKVQEIDLFGEVAGIGFSPDAQVLFVAISDSMYSSLLQYQRASPHCA